MTAGSSLTPLKVRPWLVPAAVIVLALAILGGTIFYGALQLREKTRRQILQRDAEILHAVALMQQVAGETTDGLGGKIEEIPDQFHVALQISRLKGVIAARLFDAQGRFVVAFPARVAVGRLEETDLRQLRQLKPVSRFVARARLADLFAKPPQPASRIAKEAPLLEVNIPLHRLAGSSLAGIAQLVMDGNDIVQEFAVLDRNLIWQGITVFCASGLVMAVGLVWAFRRLNRSHRLLWERTEHLLQANRELVQAAKTSALGAVAAHLVHGLSSPLTGLQDFIASRQEDNPGDDEWQHAVASTRRMQALVQDVVRVVSEENVADRYELSLSELVSLLQTKLQSLAQTGGVRWLTDLPVGGAVNNRDANLMLFILENLVQNAIQATPPGKSVRLRIRKTEPGWAWEVEDEGPGLPEHLVLFRPCRSSKTGGSGIGLAICKQLAAHLGAALELGRSSPAGCLFCLRLPEDKIRAQPVP